MPYTPTDTARAAPKLERDLLTLEANETAAWDSVYFPLIDNLGTVAAAQRADKAITERRKRIVAARVGQGRLPLLELADAVDGYRNSQGHLTMVNLSLTEVRLVSAAAAVIAAAQSSPPPSALTPEQAAVIDAAREWREDGSECAHPAAARRLDKAVQNLNAAEGRPQQ